jgi:hypothetical protein
MKIRIGNQIDPTQSVTIDNAGQLTTVWGDDTVIGIKTTIGFFVITSNGNDIELQRGTQIVYSEKGEQHETTAN